MKTKKRKLSRLKFWKLKAELAERKIKQLTRDFYEINRPKHFDELSYEQKVILVKSMKVNAIIYEGRLLEARLKLTGER